MAPECSKWITPCRPRCRGKPPSACARRQSISAARSQRLLGQKTQCDTADMPSGHSSCWPSRRCLIRRELPRGVMWHGRIATYRTALTSTCCLDWRRRSTGSRRAFASVCWRGECLLLHRWKAWTQISSEEILAAGRWIYGSSCSDLIDRFAPGFRECVLARRVFTPASLESMDANLIGGDISGGAVDLRQFLFRPTRKHYATSARNIYLCSSSTPPGGGVHGMCGYNAANLALSRL